LIDKNTECIYNFHAMKEKIYLDNNSTTPPLKRAVDAMAEAAGTYFGNPSSYHAIGADARLIVENARIGAAKLIGSSPSEITFVSSGTEANNLAIFGVCDHFRRVSGKKKMNVVATAVEHHSVTTALAALAWEGVEIRTVGVSADCVADPDDFKKAVDEDTVLVCAMTANNETGVVLPFEKIGKICSESGKLFFTDAVCAAGKMPLRVADIGCDLLSFSSHKIRGPKGAACLFVKKGVGIFPRTHGGHQENGMRAGTENAKLTEAFGVNVPLMVTLTYGFGVALAGFAGVLAAPILQVQPLMGSNLIIVVFAVVVIGGMGSILGSILTGLGLGVIEGFTKVFYPEASSTVVFLIMAIVLLIRPAGLFGKEK